MVPFKDLDLKMVKLPACLMDKSGFEKFLRMLKILGVIKERAGRIDLPGNYREGLSLKRFHVKYIEEFMKKP